MLLVLTSVTHSLVLMQPVTSAMLTPVLRTTKPTTVMLMLSVSTTMIYSPALATFTTAAMVPHALTLTGVQITARTVTLPQLVKTLIEHTPATVVTAATESLGPTITNVQLGPTTAIPMQLTLIQSSFFYACNVGYKCNLLYHDVVKSSTSCTDADECLIENTY